MTQDIQNKSDLPKMSKLVQRALAFAGLQRLEQLTKISEAEIKLLHAIDPMRSLSYSAPSTQRD